MKRTIALILAVAMVLTLVPMTALAAEGITVSTVKTDFYVGESITTSNFSVTYEDAAGNKFDIGSDFKINDKSSVSFKKPGTQTLTISYETAGGTILSATVANVKIHAKEDYLDVSLSTAGALRKFVAGDTVSAEDFVVLYYKADATAPEATLTAADYTLSGTKLEAGDNTVTASYGSVKGSYTITGVAPKNDPALIMSGEAKVKYGLGEVFDPAGLTFAFQPRNSTTDAQKNVTANVTWTPTDVFSEIGDKTVTFSYTEGEDTVTATLNVTVVGQVNKFEIKGSVQQFYAGQVFDPAGLTATVYDYQENVLVNHVFGVDADSADFTWSKTPLMAGQTSIDLVYTHQATGETIKRAVDINVVSKLAKLTHTAGDIKTYYVGEEFDPTGLEFTLLYSDGSTEFFCGATLGSYAKLSWPAGVFTAAGTYMLPVSYKDDLTGETVSCELQIVIKDPKAAKIQAATVVPELKVVVGDNFEPDKLFEVTFQKANTEGFERLSYTNGDYTISPAPASFTTEGMQTFTITKDGVSTTVTVEVLPVIKLMTVAGVGDLDIYGGDIFDPTGLEFTVYYNMGSLWASERTPETFDHNDMDPYANFEWPQDKLLKGTKTITMTFTDPTTGAKAAKDIEFTVKPLLKELVAKNSTAVKFYADEPFSAKGLDLSVKLNNGEADLVLTKDDVTFDNDDLKAGKNQSIVLSYTHKDSGETITCEFVFDVLPTTYELKSAVSGPKKVKYSEGELFDPAGISWQVIKNGDAANPITVTSGFKCYPDRELTPADTSMTVVFGNIAQVYDVEVSGRTLVSIAVTQAPDAASFHVGQRFDPEGMIVTATYNNKTTSEVSEFTYDSAPFVDADIGTKEIKLTYKEGGVTAETTYKATIVAAPIRAASLVLSKSTLQLIESKDETINATVYPTNATNQSLIWTSSDTSVARVDQSGKIVAVGAGACVISANTTDGSNRYADCYVVVQPKVDVKKLVLKASTMELLVGDTTTLTATIEPDNATWNVANWTTSNPEVVSVNADGQIKGEKIGSATITASADGVEASITIKVVKELTKYGTVVNCSRRVNVRSSASGSAKVLGYAYLGTNYVVTGEEGNWYEIVYNGDTAYIWKEYLDVASKSYVSDSENTGTGTEGGTATITPTTPTVYTKLKVVNCKRYVYVRKGPSTATSKVGHAKPGEEYKLLGQSGTWYIIEFNGQQAYISSQFGQLS